MELIKHLGLVPQRDPTVLATIYKLRGLIIWYILFNALVGYQIISCISSLLCYTFPDASTNVKRKACIMFWDLCIYFMNANNINVEVTGDSIPSESAVFLSNHRSLVDHLVINYLARYSYASNKSLEIPIVNFFTWFLIWKVPTLKILVNMAKNDENWELDSQLADGVFNKLIISKKTEWLVLFPEVNIFTDESAQLQKIQSEKFYLPIFEYLLYPRFSSLFNVILVLKTRDHHKFNRLFDLTIYYYHLNEFDEKQYISPNLLNIFGSEQKLFITINVKNKNLTRISANRQKLERWLEKTWIEKDQQLKQAYSS